MSQTNNIYPTIQVVPIDEVRAEYERIYLEILSLRAALERKPNEIPLSDKDAAKRLKKSVATLERMKADGRIGSVANRARQTG